jgi:hypothetical protein
VLGTFAALLAVFALSMFDVYELRLPAAWTQRVTDRSQRLPAGQVAGVFLVLAQCEGKAAAFLSVHDALVGRRDCTAAEADAFGSAMVRLDPGRAAPYLAEWLKPRRGLLKALGGSKQGDMLRLAAVSGLASDPGPKAQAQLEALAKGDEDEAFHELHAIRRKTTYYDLLGCDDYVEQFRQAMFLPHTNIELFPSLAQPQTAVA